METSAKKQKVIVIVGPTAVGKTALSIELAQVLQGEIISGDSLQVYRGLDIGTAKATDDEQAKARHHLIDIREWQESYSVADFQQEGRAAIAAITKQGKIPIIVGGTGLYIQALLYDFKLGNEGELSQEQQAKVRQLEASSAQWSNQELWEQLSERDPLAAEQIHFNNRRKVLRALEVMLTTGHSITTPKETPVALYDYFLIGLTTERAVLYERINQRVVMMVQQGLIEEAKRFLTAPNVQALQGIGYKEWLPYFHEEATLDETVALIQLHSRRYAKRQLTWFRNRMAPYWLDLLTHPEEKITLLKKLADWRNDAR